MLVVVGDDGDGDGDGGDVEVVWIVQPVLRVLSIKLVLQMQQFQKL
jgi:hypothetical protein